MVFSGLSFLLFFLPLTLGLYYLSGNRIWRNAVLLSASLFFYSWGEPENILLMLSATAVGYAGTMLMHRFANRGNARVSLLLYIGTLGLIIANLFAFKYLNFVAENFSILLSCNNTIPEIALPIGISFYTFQILSYVIDLRRGDVALQRNPLYLLLYVSLFPQLIAGPIVRYQTIETEIVQRRESWADFLSGLERFAVGLGKKLLLANNFALICDTIHASALSTSGSAVYWIAALAYAFQIFFDFSGYSDMAIGLGQMFGFHFPENFNYPYQALSITDFWRRWHISLSSWFRDYVYIPLGGNRVAPGRWLLNILAVWGLTGIWHGAEWNFILWGLYYGLLLIAEKLFLHKLLDRLPKALRWAYTFFIITIGWVIFRQTDLPSLGHVLSCMFSFCPTDWLCILTEDSTILKSIVLLPLGFLFSFPLPFFRRLRHWSRLFLTLFLMGLCLMVAVSSSYNPFIYFQF